MKTWIVFLYTIQDPSGAELMQQWMTPTQSIEECRARLPDVKRFIRGYARQMAEKNHAGIHFVTEDGECVVEGSEDWNYMINELPKTMHCRTTDYLGDEPLIVGSQAMTCSK